MFLFRVERSGFQLIFMLLCIPAFFLHEAGFIFMLVFLFACMEKFRTAADRPGRIFFRIVCDLIRIGYYLGDLLNQSSVQYS